MHPLSTYAAEAKPKLAALFVALGLDRDYVRGAGSYLYGEDGEAVLDLVSGFGATLMGHSPPALVRRLIGDLESGVPTFVQASIRGDVGRLGARLNAELARERGAAGQGYYLHLSNSGAEAMEAAIKHAYKVLVDRVGREQERLARLIHDFKHRWESDAIDLPAGHASVAKLCEEIAEQNLRSFESVRGSPSILALKGAYHGKTASALKITFNKTYREAFEGLSALRPVFIDLDAQERLAEVLRAETLDLFYPLAEGGRVVLRPIPVPRVLALALEPILGEGGVRPVPEATLARLAELHDELRVPFIVDEVQTGSGRTGRIFDFTQTPLGAIEPDYILLGKSLGGGLGKIGATLIRRDRYDPDFGLLHSSTFAEDGHSTRLALATLDELTRDDGALLTRIADLGSALRRRLEGLCRRFPRVLREVRGRGLMLGLELAPLDHAGPFLRGAGRQGVLSLLIASYLLRWHGIRLIAPISTMLPGNPGRSRQSVLRIQPPATLTEADMDRLVAALGEALTAIDRNNEGVLVGHLMGVEPTPAERADPARHPALWPIAQHSGEIDARTGFVAHPTRIEHLADYYFPSLAGRMDLGRLRAWWDRLAPFLEPQHCRTSLVTSRGFVVESNLIFVPYLPEYLTADHPEPVRQAIRDKVQDAVTLARELGDDNIPTAVVGLGAYTSIVTDNGRTLNDYDVPVTTGNGFTAALVLEGLARAAQERGRNLADCTAAVVGAAGNIGMVLAQILAGHVGRLILVARPGESGLYRLRLARRAVLEDLARGWLAGDAAGPGPLAEALRGLAEASGLLAPGTDAATLARALEGWLDPWPADLGGAALTLVTDLSTLAEADLVAVATNSADPELIRPEQVRPGAIVCCASVPSNLSRGFAGSGHFAFDGGLARLPEGSSVDMVGMPGDGSAFGCLAETLVLGFEGTDRSFCKGLLTPAHVRSVLDMAERHGFGLGDYRLIGDTRHDLPV